MDGHPGREWVAVILAVGLATSLNMVTIAAVYDAVAHNEGLSENATQVLTTALGGIIGVLGGYLGYKAGVAQGKAEGNGLPLEDQGQADG